MAYLYVIDYHNQRAYGVPLASIEKLTCDGLLYVFDGKPLFANVNFSTRGRYHTHGDYIQSVGDPFVGINQVEEYERWLDDNWQRLKASAIYLDATADEAARQHDDDESEG